MTEKISRGAQFKGFISLIGLIIFPFALVLGIVALVYAAIIAGFLLLLLATAAFFLFLDVRGVEFDHANKRVRRYKQYMNWHWGEWQSLEDFGELHVVKDTFHATSTRNRYGRRVGNNPISTFDVVLVAREDGPGILLSEFAQQSDAVAFMKKYADKLQLPARNIYAELQQSAVNRRTTRR